MTAVVWDFGEYNGPVRKAWRDLCAAARERSKKKYEEAGDAYLAPYSIVVTVLQQLTGGYVHIDRTLGYMVALEPIEPKVLQRVFSYLDAIVHRTDIDDVPFQAAAELADLIAKTEPRRLAIADTIKPGIDRMPPNPPSWAYEAVKWHIARRLASEVFLDRETVPIRTPLLDEDGEPEFDKNDQPKYRIRGWKPADVAAEIRYRPTSEGELIAWDNPIGPAFAHLPHPIDSRALSNAFHDALTPRQREYALNYISIKMATYTAEPYPVLNLDLHIRRISNSVVYSRTVMLDQGPNHPVLSVTLDGRGLRRTNKHALEILAKMEADRTALDAIETYADHESELRSLAKEKGETARFLTPPPGRVRPVSANDIFAVGTGAGLHHLDLLTQHIRRVFGDTANFVELRSNGSTFHRQAHEPADSAEKALRKERKAANEYVDVLGKPSPDSIRSAVHAAGYSTLRILCLWYREATLDRMIHTLAATFEIDPETIDPAPTGGTVTLADGIEATFYYASDLLAHGPGDTREADAREVLSKFKQDGTLLAAWCETEFPTRDLLPPDTKSGDVTRLLGEIDAKFQVTRVLAAADVNTQFLVGRKQETFDKTKFTIIPRPANIAEDHRANMALRDIYRSCGVVDDRFERAAYLPGGTYQIPRMAFCGIHVRKQADKGKFGQPKRIVTASVLIPSHEEGGPWRMLGWSNINQVWEPYPQALSNFQKKSYPTHASNGAGDEERWIQAGRDVQAALLDLVDEELDALPYALLLDGNATRRIWPGLHNNKQGRDKDPAERRPWLPSHGLPEASRPVSILRINCAQEEMPRLAFTTEVLSTGPKVRKTSSELFYPTDRPAGHPWFLFTEPRNYGKKRHGQFKTRWHADPGITSESASERKENELNSPWYAMTTREITPMYTLDGFDREALAVATARLSHESISWADRTRYPAPLHAALQMDLDHPEFRRSKSKMPDEEKILRDAGASEG